MNSFRIFVVFVYVYANVYCEIERYNVSAKYLHKRSIIVEIYKTRALYLQVFIHLWLAGCC